jgi:hypothetical protein
MTASAVAQRGRDLQTAASSVSSSAPARHDGSITAIAWSAAGELEYRDWVLEGRRIGIMWRGSPWWIGDWLLYGTARWGEMYVQAAKITGYDPKTLRNMRYVASRFDLSLRRDNLTWSHHALLASLERDAQKYWLERASADRLSVEDLRIELRAERHRGVDEASTLLSNNAPGRVDLITCPSCGDRIPVPAVVSGRAGHPLSRPVVQLSGTSRTSHNVEEAL